MCNVLDWKYIFFSMSFQVPFPQSFSQFSLSSFELGWLNPKNHLLAQCTFEDWLGKPTQSEHRAMMKVFLCYQPVPSPSWAVRQNILLDNSRTTWEHLPCPFLFGALLHNLTNTQQCFTKLRSVTLVRSPDFIKHIELKHIKTSKFPSFGPKKKSGPVAESWSGPKKSRREPRNKKWDRRYFVFLYCDDTINPLAMWVDDYLVGDIIISRCWKFLLFSLRAVPHSLHIKYKSHPYWQPPRPLDDFTAITNHCVSN